MVAALVVGALVLGVVSLQIMAAENSFRMQDLSRRGAELRQEQGELRLEIAELSSPRRIEREARRLGLHLSDDVETLRVPATVGSQAREPGSGGSASGQALSGGSP
jgi:cell division protein FtsL